MSLYASHASSLITLAEAPGIYGYAAARGLTTCRVFGNEQMTIETLIENLFVRGFESTVRFAKSAAYLEAAKERYGCREITPRPALLTLFQSTDVQEPGCDDPRPQAATESSF